MKQTSPVSQIVTITRPEEKTAETRNDIDEFKLRPCTECDASLVFVKESMMICDSCQQDIGRADGYKCSVGCQFAVCSKCGECNNRHLMARA